MEYSATSKILGVSFPHGDAEAATRKGLPSRSVAKLAKSGGLSDDQLARILGVSSRTLVRIRAKHNPLLSPVESDRVMRLARVLAEARGVFGDDDKMRAWVHDPIVALGGKAPVEFFDTDAGLRRVEDLLGLIDYGGLS